MDYAAWVALKSLARNQIALLFAHYLKYTSAVLFRQIYNIPFQKRYEKVTWADSSWKIKYSLEQTLQKLHSIQIYVNIVHLYLF